jgi:hypothetical protein
VKGNVHEAALILQDPANEKVVQDLRIRPNQMTTTEAVGALGATMMTVISWCKDGLLTAERREYLTRAGIRQEGWLPTKRSVSFAKKIFASVGGDIRKARKLLLAQRDARKTQKPATNAPSTAAAQAPPAIHDVVETIHKKLDEHHGVVVGKLDRARGEIVERIGTAEEKIIEGTTPKKNKKMPLTVYHHGGRSYSFNGAPPATVSIEEHNVLAAFARACTSLVTKEIENAGCTNVARVMGKLIDKFPGAAMKNPGKGAGYFICVQPVPTK